MFYKVRKFGDESPNSLTNKILAGRAGVRPAKLTNHSVCTNLGSSYIKVKKSKKPLLNFELQLANNYANIFEDVKNKLNKLEIMYRNNVLNFKQNYKKNNNHDYI